MKTKIDGIKNKAKHLPARSLALVLCFVMLLSAIGVGSVFTAIAKETRTSDAGILAEAAKLGAVNTSDADGSSGGFFNDLIGLLRNKEDIAGTGADADIAQTGWDGNASMCGTFNSWSTTSITGTITDNKADITHTFTAGTYEFKVHANENYFGNGGTYSPTNSGDNFDLPKGDGSNVSITFPRTGSYTFHLSFSDNNCRISVTSLPPASYAISYNSPSNGSFTTRPTTGTAGNSISVVATPNTGYEIGSYSVTKTGTSTTVSATRTGNTIKFTMPSSAVTVSVTFTQVNYSITANGDDHVTISPNANTYHYGDTAGFSIVLDTDYALQTLSVKQGANYVEYTSSGNSYSFTMPAGNVTITATSANTAGDVTFYFKSATAYVYHPFITVNDGAEVEMTVDAYLDNSTNAYHPKSETGSLRYAWYKATISSVDTTKAVNIKVRGKDTYMEAVGSFNIEDNGTYYFACDNLMEGKTLVDITSLSAADRDFYDTPLNMIDD